MIRFDYRLLECLRLHLVRPESYLLEPDPRPIPPRGLTWCQPRNEPWRTLMMSRSRIEMIVCRNRPPMLDFGNALTILISTEFNVVALPFCKPYCFVLEIPYCPLLKVPLLVFEKFLSTFYQVLT